MVGERVRGNQHKKKAGTAVVTSHTTNLREVTLQSPPFFVRFTFTCYHVICPVVQVTLSHGLLITFLLHCHIPSSAWLVPHMTNNLPCSLLCSQNLVAGFGLHVQILVARVPLPCACKKLNHNTCGQVPPGDLPSPSSLIPYMIPWVHNTQEYATGDQ